MSGWIHGAGNESRHEQAVQPSRDHVDWTARFEIALLGIGIVVLFFAFPHHLAGDDNQRFYDVQLLREHLKTTADTFSLAIPILSLPFVALGTLVKSPAWWATRFNVIVITVAVVANYSLLRGSVSPRLLRRFFLILLFASMLTYQLRTYSTEVAGTAFIATGITLLSVGRAKLGWGLLVWATVNTPAAVVGLALVSGAETIRLRRLRLLLPVLAALILIGAENWIRRGTPFVGRHDTSFPTQLPYSGRPGFSYPFLLGVVSLLFAAGRGLLFYAPGLTLWLLERTRQLAGVGRRNVLLLLLFIGGMILVYARWESWYGGNAWGPRFLTVAAVPASLALALRLRDVGRSAAADAFTLCLLTLSGWIAVAGVLASADHSEPLVCTANGYAVEAFCWYVPEFSSLWYPILGFDRRYWVSDPHHSPGVLIALGLIVVIYVYLAAPLVRPVLRAGTAKVARTLRGPGWRF